jgi:SAM-dependent methyltransferase
MVDDLLPLGPGGTGLAARCRLWTAVTRASQLLRLNARVAGLALAGKWLTATDVAQSYDRVAPTYNDAWQRRLQPVTDRFLARLPNGLTGRILDLGCGTGYATAQLAVANPTASLIGVDISPGMLAHARKAAPPNAQFACADMLAFARGAPPESARMIVSTWALGYSHPARLFKECHRVLVPGGRLGFIVNYFDTLAPVFRAFQTCMLRFPSQVRRAAWPRFPRHWPALETQLRRAGFHLEWHEDGAEPITPPTGPKLPWLRQTGILAGFDAMLNLSGPVEQMFEAELQRDMSGMVHHYAAVVAAKP